MVPSFWDLLLDWGLVIWFLHSAGPRSFSAQEEVELGAWSSDLRPLSSAVSLRCLVLGPCGTGPCFVFLYGM